MNKFIVFFLLCFSLSLHSAEEMDLYSALLSQDWVKAERLLDINPHLLNKQGEEEFITTLGGHVVSSVGRTPLTFSIENDLDQMAIELLEYGADSETTDREGWTPLMVASYMGNRQLAKILLEQGAIIEVFDERGLSPLSLAIGACRFETADLLLEWKADLYEDIPGVFPLSQSIYKSKIHVRKSLRIIDVGATGYPLLKGVEEGRYSLVRTILLQGMNPDMPDSQGITALMIAASMDNPYMTELLIDQGAQVNQTEEGGLNPLSLAIFFGQERNFELLLKGGALIDGGPSLEASPLYYGLISGQEHLTAQIIKEGCKIDTLDSHGRTPLMYAAFLGDWLSLRTLLEWGANPATLDADGNNVIFYAVEGYLRTGGENYYTIIDQLIESGATSREWAYKLQNDPTFYELLEARWRD